MAKHNRGWIGKLFSWTSDRATGRKAAQRPAGQPRVEELEPRVVMQGGTWTAVANQIPDSEGAQHMLLLSDGRIMVQGGNDLGNQLNANRWYALKPNSAGSYINGTWSTLTPMSTQRQFYGSVILPSGKLLVVGGEDSGTPIANNEINTGEIYDPLTNAWTPVADYPETEFGDGNLEVLPNGTVIGTYLNDVQNFIYHPATNNWTAAANKLNGDPTAEEGLVKLPDGSLLCYEIQGTQPQTAMRYVPQLNQWFPAGSVPVRLDSDGGNTGIVPELGPGFLLPNGKVLWIGASNHTAIYTPPTTLTGTGSWVAGPDIPNNLGAFDAPGCVLPNGDVLFIGGVQDGNNFPPPTTVFEYSPSTNAITQVAVPTALQTVLTNNPAFLTRLIVLPSGQVMMSLANRQLWVFTPNGGPQNSWRPTITSISQGANGVFTLTGRQLNGLDEGSLYGDDGQNATNYPLVRLTDSSGRVFYARTFNWSSTGVATGNALVTCQFVLPAGVSGSATIVVVANGIPSLPFSVNPVTVYFPLRWIYDPASGTYFGNLTLVDNSFLPVSGTIRILFPSLPPGVTLANAAGFQNGVPFLQTSGTLVPNGAPLRLLIRLRNPQNVPLSTFFEGFAVVVRFL
jgi:hypothetical protein